jgi:hypothetical protein
VCDVDGPVPTDKTSEPGQVGKEAALSSHLQAPRERRPELRYGAGEWLAYKVPRIQHPEKRGRALKA